MDNQSPSQTLFTLATQDSRFPAYLSALPQELISAELPAYLAEDAAAALIANDPTLADRISAIAQPQTFGIPAGVTIPALCALLFIMGLKIEATKEPSEGWRFRIAKDGMDPVIIFKSTLGEVLRYLYQLLDKLVDKLRKK